MAWVKTFEEQEATGKLAEVYDQVRKHPLSRGRIPNIIKAIGLPVPMPFFKCGAPI